jgi:muramoyltetrapeptide carboxypeptidase
MLNRPVLVPSGAPIAVIAPSGAHNVERFEAGMQLARAAGLNPVSTPGMLQPDRYLAAPDIVRLRQLQHALSDPSIAAVWAARGGYGLTRILDRIDFEDVTRKAVIGFSDLTALFSALSGTRARCVHGPVVHSLPITDEASIDHLARLLGGQPVEPLEGETWIPGSASGRILGGNLCLLAATCGTAHQLDARGAILVLEEIGEPAYRVDRMLQQLISAGVLPGVAGVALGEFVDCRVPDGSDYTLRDVLVDHLAPLGVPVLGALPIGHGAANRAFLWGAPARIEGGRLLL